MATCKGVLPMDPLTASGGIQSQAEQPGLLEVTTSGTPLLADLAMDDIDPDMAEVYFLLMHFLAKGPCQRAFLVLWNELLEHKLLPRRFHAWYSRGGKQSGDENDDGVSFPLSYNDLVARHPIIEQNHLVKLLQQLLVYNRKSVATWEPGHSRIPTAADVPTLLGAGAFSLLDSERSQAPKEVSRWTRQLRWPHWQADQVHGLMLRQIGGGFSRHHRAPTIRTASYVVTKPAILVDRIQIIKRLRGHRNAVYCAIFDNTGQYVITGSDDRLVKIWSTETGLCLRSCRGHEGDITDMAVSSGNSLVASASNDHSIRVWGLPNGIPVSVLRGHTAAVTAIAFSPRQGCEHLLLSSSDDGTCRIWDAKDSTLNSRVYMPNPRDLPTGSLLNLLRKLDLKTVASDSFNSGASRGIGVPTPPLQPPSNQVLCCAFNADGSIFVTGSSDKMARVWDARKWNDDVTGRPNYELDTLRGHEHDVNYVQFSGCAAPARPAPTDVGKEDYQSHFKNSWFAHDSIVTCSRDGSAIIWTPRPRKHHVSGKVGRWQKAYHLRVPPPPMPPQPPRGNGPRQRLLPTPRGVNMIVWSLDNRFVLAAIMDHRICVWNAVDGSLVHSLTGHDKQTYVLDVHPFNPRIAMSAGYDGRVIIWDIWEGHPIKVYETGDYQLVDGNFSPDGASLVVSDEVGQIYIFGTGPEMSSKDVKYDQFFLGDFRPLVRDTFGNVLDAETQLAPHQRNVQDLLCDSNLIPYPEPYQSIYQQRRLGALGIDWTPPQVFLAIGTTDDAVFAIPTELPLPFQPAIAPSSPDRRDRRGLGNGGNRWVEQPSEADEAMDWEQEVAGLSEDTGSNYSASEESQSEDDGKDVGCEASDEEGSDEDEEEEESDGRMHLRRSRRNKRKTVEYIHTASGRRVRRRTFTDDDCSERRPRRRQPRISRPGQLYARTVQEPVATRPQRQAARNALNLFTSYNSSHEEDDNPRETRSSTPEALPQTEAERRTNPVTEDMVAVSLNVEPWLLDLPNGGGETVTEGQEPIGVVIEHAVTNTAEVVEPPGECRRPRSQRRLIVKLRKQNEGSSGGAAEGVLSEADALEGLEDRNIDGIATLNDGTPVERAPTPSEQLEVAPTLLQVEGPSHRKIRKLVIKPPIKPVDRAIETVMAGMDTEQAVAQSDTPPTGHGKAPIMCCDEDPSTSYADMSHEEKRKWEWKKVKAAKRARGSTSPDLRAAPHGTHAQNDASHSTSSQIVQNSVGSYLTEILKPVEAPRISDTHKVNVAVLREQEKKERSVSSSLAGVILKPCSNGAVEKIGSGQSDHQLLENLVDGAQDMQQDEKLEVTCVENKGSEASMDYMELPTWRQARQAAGTVTQERTKNSPSGDSEDDTKALTSSPKEKSRDNKLEISIEPNKQEQEHNAQEQNIQLGGSDNEEEEVACEGNGELSVDESEPECELSEKAAVAESSSNGSDAEEGRDSLLSLRGERLSARAIRDAEVASIHESDDEDEPPPIKNLGMRGTKQPHYNEQSEEEEEEGPESEQDEYGDKGNSHSDLYEDTQVSAYGWSDSGRESDDISIEVGRKTTRPKRQRALGELGSYARQASTSNRPEQIDSHKVATGKRRIRDMKSVLSKSGRETRTRSSSHKVSRRQSQTRATPSNWYGDELSEEVGRPKRKVPQTVSKSSRSSRRNQAISFEGDPSGREVERLLDYDTGEKALRGLTSRGKEDYDRREKGKAVDSTAGGLTTSIRGQRGGRRNSKSGSRSPDIVAWLLTEDVERGTRFIPQFGDEVVYLRQGHQDFLEESHMDEKGPWKTYARFPVRAVEYCRIEGLEYIMDHESGKVSCKLVLEFTDHNSRLVGKTFKLTLPELTNYPDFLVERSRFDASLRREWSPRDHCQVWWASEEDDGGKGGSWWDGRIKQIKAKSKQFPDSPWEMYHVTYKVESSEATAHSPWELFDKEYKIKGCELPSINKSIKEGILDVLHSIDKSSSRKLQDEYGVKQHRRDVKDRDYVSRIPLPLSFDTVLGRVERDYYHSTEALEHDVQLLVSNTIMFHGKDSEEVNKMQELASCIMETLQ